MARLIALKGFCIKDGRIIRDERRLDVSMRLKQRSSKRIRLARRGMHQVKD